MGVTALRRWRSLRAMSSLIVMSSPPPPARLPSFPRAPRPSTAQAPLALPPSVSVNTTSAIYTMRAADDSFIRGPRLYPCFHRAGH